MSWPDGVPSVEADVREVAMRRFGLVAHAVAASVMMLMAASLIGLMSPAPAEAAAPAGARLVGGPVIRGPAISGPVIGGPVIGGPVIGGPVIGAPIIGAPVIGAPVTPTAAPSCPTLAEWNSETHDGSHPGPVPNVMGMTRANAVAALAQGGFDTEATPSDAAAVWTVTDQTPTSGELADCGSTVAIDLEAPTVEVPDVVGDPLDQAEQKVRDQGLVSSVAQGEAADPRVVASQDPAAGTRVPKGSTVTLRLRPPTPVSPTPVRVTVPDLSGLSASAARRRVQERGLTLVIGSGGSGSVNEQDPAAGSLVERGSSVTVTLTPITGPTDPASPDVTPTDTDESPEAGSIDPVGTDSSSTPLPIWLVAALVAAAVLVWALRRARRTPATSATSATSVMPAMPMPTTSATPPTPSVVCVPYADLSPYLELREPAPSLSLDFVCHHDQGRQEIREIVR
ncbi:MAG TPA: PASTA domain-containing protein [Nonomuraea sp.]|nr:PASTA domain-containing protein [Nonomuraea sp.]